ncbi:hypothetical protein MTO96_009831 [Rhipicephalus appendiculatus]
MSPLVTRDVERAAAITEMEKNKGNLSDEASKSGRRDGRSRDVISLQCSDSLLLRGSEWRRPPPSGDSLPGNAKLACSRIRDRFQRDIGARRGISARRHLRW